MMLGPRLPRPSPRSPGCAQGLFQRAVLTKRAVHAVVHWGLGAGLEPAQGSLGLQPQTLPHGFLPCPACPHRAQQPG